MYTKFIIFSGCLIVQTGGQCLRLCVAHTTEDERVTNVVPVQDLE